MSALPHCDHDGCSKLSCSQPVPAAGSDTSPRSNGLKLEEINPSLHPKFSPNLHQLLRNDPFQRRYARLWRDKEGDLWIGWIDEGIFLIGARIMQALCFGGKCEVVAWTLSSIGELTEVEDFWPQYVARGRCAIDPEHRQVFVGDSSRFTVSGDQRECTWCGHKQYLRRWTETIERSRWESQNAKAEPGAQ